MTAQQMTSEVCMVKFNMKVEENEILKKALNNTQIELNKLKKKIEGTGKSPEVANL